LSIRDAITAKNNGWLPDEIEIIIPRPNAEKLIQARAGGRVYPITERHPNFLLSIKRGYNNNPDFH